MVGEISPEKATGQFPRVLAPDYLWTGDCLKVEFDGQLVHGHVSIFVIKGSGKTLLVDTGHPMFWRKLERDVETFLDGRKLDYLFATHGEFPHAGLLPQWMAKYSDCIAVGDLRDYKYFYPDLADRIRPVVVGDRIDLGDREFVFVPAVWRDLNNTLWGFETKYRTLFVSDGFAYLHYHHKGECDELTSEHPAPELKLIQFYNERALQWTNYKNARVTFSDMDKLFATLRPKLVAAAHGAIMDNPREMLELCKRGMMVDKAAEAAPLVYQTHVEGSMVGSDL